MKLWEYFRLDRLTGKWSSLKGTITDKELQVINSNRRLNYDKELDTYTYEVEGICFALKPYINRGVTHDVTT